jgi:hypothetical protein
LILLSEVKGRLRAYAIMIPEILIFLTTLYHFDGMF